MFSALNASYNDESNCMTSVETDAASMRSVHRESSQPDSIDLDDIDSDEYAPSPEREKRREEARNRHFDMSDSDLSSDESESDEPPEIPGMSKVQ